MGEFVAGHVEEEVPRQEGSVAPPEHEFDDLARVEIASGKDWVRFVLDERVDAEAPFRHDRLELSGDAAQQVQRLLMVWVVGQGANERNVWVLCTQFRGERGSASKDERVE